MVGHLPSTQEALGSKFSIVWGRGKEEEKDEEEEEEEGGGVGGEGGNGT